MEELTVRTEETGSAGGRILRASHVQRPRDSGATVVLERLPGSAGARSLLEPSTGERLTVDADALPELLDLLGALGD